MKEIITRMLTHFKRKTIMKKIILVTALLIASPAGACTDWKAVVAFDEAILGDARTDFENAGKTDQEVLMRGPEQVLQAAETQLRVDRDSALTDPCRR
jgi:hypothetical protein